MKFSIAPAVQKTVNGKRQLDMGGFLAECEAAEATGWYGAYSGEKHVGDTTYTTNALLPCVRGLSQFKNLKFGTSVTVLPTNHPVRIAEDACLVDAMFPGRFRLTVGVGYFQGDFDPFGVTTRQRKRLMDQGMEVIAAHRAGREMQIEGPWAGKVPPRDPALGKDGLEVFIGAWSVPGVLRAARMADGWITDPIRSWRKFIKKSAPSWVKNLASCCFEKPGWKKLTRRLKLVMARMFSAIQESISRVAMPITKIMIRG